MKSARRFDLKRNLSGIVGLALIVLSFIAFAFESTVFADGGIGGNTDDGSGGRPCTSGNCYSPRQNGAFWVEIELNGETKTFQQVFGSSGYSAYDTNGNTVFSNCPTTAYVLVSRLGNGGLAGPIDINKVSTGSGNTSGPGVGATKIKDPDGGWMPGIGHSNAEAEAKFNEHAADFYNPKFGQYFYGTNMGWFCADPFGSTTSTTTTTTPPPWYDGCYARREREWGDTQTRIAVRNRTLDDPVQNYHHNWKTTHGGIRAGITNDSGWSPDGADVYTIAKPGDSVQFLHTFCAGARYVRRTQDQSVEWTGAESHNVLFDIPTNHFKIHANIEPGYLFGDGISWMNSEAVDVPEYGPPDGPYPFQGTAPISNGTYISTDRFGLGTLSPTPNNNSYNCNGVSMYAAWGVGYKSGASFQIPGYDSGWSCAAAGGGRPSNTVGKVVQQWHEFNSVKAWEQWTHNRSGSCGCNVHDAVHLGNFFSPEYGKIGSEWGKRHKWECGAVCTLCCGWTCDNCCTEYGSCISGSNKLNSWPYIPEDFEMSYQSKSKDYGQRTKKATVYVPFNFNTSVKSGIDSGTGPTVFQGSPVSSDFDWAVLPRNNNVLAGFDFATVTPSWTKVQFVEFLYKPGGESVTDSQTSTADPCGYYSGAEQCKVIHTITGNQNPEGRYDGKKGSAGYTRTIPDDSEYVGYKYCVAMGFYPSDSHNYQSNTLSNNKSYGWNGAMDAGEMWNISNASCRTIAKKPNMQVWNGSLYTEGKVTTSISKKITGSDAPLGRPDVDPEHNPGNNYDGSLTRIFGSWTDYSISAMKDVRGMSSGAVIGYDNGRYDLAGGGRKTSEMNYQRINPLTIANSVEVSGKSKPGNGGVNASASIDINLNRLKARYSEKAKSYALKDGGSQKSIRTAETGMQYAYVAGNASLSELTASGHIKSYSDRPGQTTHQSGNGLYKTLLNNADAEAKSDNTLVIYVTGTLVIDGNICLGNGCTGTGMTLIDYSHGTSTNSAAKLPQVVIFAKNIEIEQNVTRIDAWLVVDGSSAADSGNINTCRNYKVNDNLAAHDAYNRYGWGNCYKTLMINGPVYAKSLTLNRTAGATHGFGPINSTDVLYRQYGATGASSDGNLGSQTPAEIFNLRADAYLWAYNQAQRYSEAVVTYMRELAPRY